MGLSALMYSFIVFWSFFLILIFAQNDEDWDGEAALRHVLLLDPETKDTPWTFKSRLITANSVESSEKFYVQVSCASLLIRDSKDSDVFKNLEEPRHEYQILEKEMFHKKS